METGGRHKTPGSRDKRQGITLSGQSIAFCAGSLSLSSQGHCSVLGVPCRWYAEGLLQERNSELRKLKCFIIARQEALCSGGKHCLFSRDVIKPVLCSRGMYQSRRHSHHPGGFGGSEWVVCFRICEQLNPECGRYPVLRCNVCLGFADWGELLTNLSSSELRSLNWA